MKAIPNLGKYGYVPPKVVHSTPTSVSKEISYLQIGLLALVAFVIMQIIRFWMNNKDTTNTTSNSETSTVYKVDVEVPTQQPMQQVAHPPTPPQVFTSLPVEVQHLYTFVPLMKGYMLTEEWNKLNSNRTGLG